MAASDGGNSAWIRKLDEPSATDSSFKDGYVDMLADRRQSFNDLPWVLKSVSTPEYKYKHPRDYSKLNRDVLSSDRVTNTIEEISKETKRPKAEVTKEAHQIVKDMAHKFNLRSVRTLGYILIKVFKQLNDHIYVNSQGISQLNELIQEYPVLLVPSHRSYFDFLIFSILCFNYDLPLPAIVAAQDFMSMAIVGTMLRNSGAFYIKRTFRSDKLYWAIFTQYVQTQLYNGDHPIEFFVEGTRSRTQKAYAPKLGMLAGSLEAYFKGLLPDVMIVPVSISYDRVLEENLFAQELLGIPKPKESTSKLFKVFNILNENYGSIHVTICPPLSVRSLSTSLHRPIHSLEPRFTISITDEEEALVETIGYKIIWAQQQNMVLSVWCLVATVLLQHPDGISVGELTETVLWLKRHANNVGAYIDWPGGVEDLEAIKSCLVAHNSYVTLKNDFVRIAEVDHGERIKKSGSFQAQTIADAATRMVLAIYRNQLVHVFVPYSFISMIIVKSQQSGRQALRNDEALTLFKLTVKQFAKEFVLDTSNINKMYEDTLRLLRHTGDVRMTQIGDIDISRSATRFVQFLSNMLLPFTTSYWLMCTYLLHTSVDAGIGRELVNRPRGLVTTCQKYILSLINAPAVLLADFELLNLDMLQNALTSLRDAGAVYYESRSGEKYAAVRIPQVSHISENLLAVSPISPIDEQVLLEHATKVSLPPKL